MKNQLYILFLVMMVSSMTFAQEKTSVQYLYKISKDKGNSLEDFAYLNSKGDTIVPFGKYSYVFTDTIRTIGFVSKKQSGFWAINNSGKELFRVLPFDNGPDNLQEGLFRILDKDAKVGFANEMGEVIIEPQFSLVDPFYKDLARFCEGCPSGLFFKSLERLEKMPLHNGKFGVIDKLGKIIIPAVYDSIEILNDLKIRAVKGKKEYFYTNNGVEIL